MFRRLIMMAGVLALAALFTISAAAEKITIRGRLARTVEAGGWLIISENDETTTKYLLLNPQQFQKQSWFQVGANVEVTGETQTDVITSYQEGVPFQASEMHLVGKPKAKSKRKK